MNPYDSQHMVSYMGSQFGPTVYLLRLSGYGASKILGLQRLYLLGSRVTIGFLQVVNLNGPSVAELLRYRGFCSHDLYLS